MYILLHSHIRICTIHTNSLVFFQEEIAILKIMERGVTYIILSYYFIIISAVDHTDVHLPYTFYFPQTVKIHYFP